MRSWTLRLVTSAALLVAGAAVTGCGEQQPTTAADPTFSHAPSSTTTPIETATPRETPKPTAAVSTSVPPGMEVDLSRVARTFLRFALGELPGPPSDTPVGVYLGGRLVRTIAGEDQQDRSQWEGLCPDPGGYAGRTCPFSVLEPLRADNGRMRVEAAPVTMSCAHPTPLGPADVGGTHVVTLVPDPRASCVDWVAVELFVNDVSQVVAVNVVWAEP